MDAYTSFAEVYDMFMDNIPYEDWCGYLTSLLKEYGITDGLVLDLGCGTGTLTELLAKEGYDMIGVDVSEDMLQEAIEKRAESGLPILYLLQDMREFELYGTVRAVVSICDSLNYILDYDDLAHVFSLVNNYQINQIASFDICKFQMFNSHKPDSPGQPAEYFYAPFPDDLRYLSAPVHRQS